MIFKEDWNKCKERFKAYWEGEILDRCCIAVTAPRNKPLDSKTELRQARDLVQKWTDSEFRLNNMMYEFSHTYYGGDALPNFWIDLGPGIPAAFMGSGYDLGEDCIWFDRKHIIKDWDNKPELRFDENTEMFKLLHNMTEYFCKNAKERFLVSMTDLGGTLDIAAYFRGAQELLYDLIDHPDEVKLLLEEIDKAWILSFEKQYEIIKQFQEGTTDWFNIWCPVRSFPVQSDFSVMISPSLFEKFTVPSIIKQTDYLDRAAYHWHAFDRPGADAQLDMLLDIDRLTGIYWTPESYYCCGDERWYPHYKKVQAKGKRLALQYVAAEKVEKLLENISPEGLFIITSCKSEDDAKELLRKVEKWT